MLGLGVISFIFICLGIYLYKNDHEHIGGVMAFISGLVFFVVINSGGAMRHETAPEDLPAKNGEVVVRAIKIKTDTVCIFRSSGIDTVFILRYVPKPDDFYERY